MADTCPRCGTDHRTGQCVPQESVIVHPIHVRVGEIVEIHWHRTPAPAAPSDPAAPPAILRERHTAPPLATWDARHAAPPADTEGSER